MEHIKELLIFKISNVLEDVYNIPEKDLVDFLLEQDLIDLFYLDKGIKSDIENTLKKNKEIFGIKSMSNEVPGQLTLGM